MKDNVQQIKELILRGMFILQGEGVLTENKGHLSYRLDDGRICMVGHLHTSAKTFEEMSIDDMILTDENGNVVEGNLDPVGEWYIHSEVYKARPDVRSVLHAHPYGSMIFGIAKQEIIPCFLHAAIFAPSVPIYDYAGQIDTLELGAEVAEKLGNNYALLLRGHGTVSVGASIEEAVVGALMLEKTAELQWKASVLGKPQPIRLNEMEGRTVKGINYANIVKNNWKLYTQKYSRPKDD